MYAHGADEENDPHQFDVTVTIEREGSGTRLTWRMVFATTEARDATVSFGAVELGCQTLERLSQHLAGA